MVVLGAIAGGGQESLEFRIGDRCAIDEEACDVDLVAMEPPRGIFPGILHIDARIVSSFNFGTAYLKIVLAFRNAEHGGRRVCVNFVAGISTIAWGRNFQSRE